MPSKSFPSNTTPLSSGRSSSLLTMSRWPFFQAHMKQLLPSLSISSVWPDRFFPNAKYFSPKRQETPRLVFSKHSKRQNLRQAKKPYFWVGNIPHRSHFDPFLYQACFLCTFEKTQGQNNSIVWPLAKNSRIFSQKTQSYEAQSKTWWYRILALKL